MVCVYGDTVALLILLFVTQYCMYVLVFMRHLLQHAAISQNVIRLADDV